jgi:D-glycero-D-manno-heptose 1,7-bisphosphate phosphatase
VDKGYMADAALVELIPGVREALLSAIEDGWNLFILTNQSGIGRGYYRIEDVHSCNTRMEELLQLPEPGFREIGIAPETPDEPSVYRKPSPRFIREMISKYALDPDECWMVGDRRTDLESGINAGIRPVYLETGEALDESVQELIRDHEIPVYPDLAAFIRSLTSA